MNSVSGSCISDKHYLRPCAEAQKMLRKRVLLSETREEFLTQLRRFLEKGDFSELQDPDTEFIRAYGLHAGDGCSAERAMDVLVRMSQ